LGTRENGLRHFPPVKMDAPVVDTTEPGIHWQSVS